MWASRDTVGRALKVLLSLLAPDVQTSISDAITLVSGGTCVILKAFKLSVVGQDILRKAGETCNTADAEKTRKLQADRMSSIVSTIKDSPLHSHTAEWVTAIELCRFLQSDAMFDKVCAVTDTELKKSLALSLEHFEVASLCALASLP